MTAFANLSAILNGVTGGNGQQVNIHKVPFVAGATPGTLVAGAITDLWQYDGQPGGAGSSAPTSAVVVTASTNGSMGQNTPAAGIELFLCAVKMVGVVQGSVIIYDRLVQHGGLSATTTGAQTTNLPTPSLTRYANGIGVEMWAEIYTQVGSTGTTITASYTNTTPTSGQSSQAVTFGGTGFREAQRILPMTIAVGDNGVTAVANLNLVASTLTAGNFGVTLAYPLVVIPVAAIGVGYIWSGVSTSGGPLSLGVAAASCLAMAWCPDTTTAPTLYGHVRLAQN